jgi:gliding motility-associated-like protein
MWGGNDGASLERKDPEAASNDASNWQTNSAGKGFSAGSQNTAFEEDTSPPEVIFSNKLPTGNIEVRFNEFIQLTSDIKFLMDGQKLMVANFDSTNANFIILDAPPSKRLAANSTTITVQNLSDVKGNITQSSEVAVAQPLEPAEIVINEIMFNPLDDPDDNKADQGEYIELRNTQDHAVSLEGLYLHDAPDEDGEVRELDPVITTAKWVPAQGKVLIHGDPATTFSESKVANFFDLESPELRSVMRVDRSTLSLSSSDDAIFISDSTGTTIDSVFYDESWHNPNIIDTRGIALERVSPGGPSNDESNWGSSVNKKGGTPNKENSLYQKNAQQPQKNGISFTPNPFSPDDDGYEDNLFINYKLDQQDYLIKVRIYDRYGRLVKELADGKQAGFEGQMIWDGRKDDGSRNRIGIYIVVFEAYNSTSGADKSFKKTAVLARKLN